jgi:hypothetical protein
MLAGWCVAIRFVSKRRGLDFGLGDVGGMTAVDHLAANGLMRFVAGNFFLELIDEAIE